MIASLSKPSMPEWRCSSADLRTRWSLLPQPPSSPSPISYVWSKLKVSHWHFTSNLNWRPILCPFHGIVSCSHVTLIPMFLCSNPCITARPSLAQIPGFAPESPNENEENSTPTFWRLLKPRRPRELSASQTLNATMVSKTFSAKTARRQRDVSAFESQAEGPNLPKPCACGRKILK